MSAQLDAGRALHQAGNLQEAERVYRRVLSEQPDNVHALHLLWSVLSQRGDFPGALEAIQNAVRHRPSDATLRYSLGTALMNVGQPGLAGKAYLEVLRHLPDFADCHFSLGHALQSEGKLRDAERSFRRSLQLDPASAPAHNHLGMVLTEQGRNEEAAAAFRQSIAINPNSARAHSNLGRVLLDLCRFAAAEESYRRALQLNSRLAPAHTGLAQTLLALGRHDEAMRHHDEAVRFAPDVPEEHSARALSANYVAGRSAEQVFEVHAQFGRQFDRASLAPHPNRPDPERRLRVGYVSSDLRSHSVAFFIEPVLAKHDRREFEVICYYNLAQGDEVTDRLKRLADAWHDVAGMSDDALAELVRSHAIDILVDLNGHTAHNRLLTFARKPAPVQATWLGYLNTTGLKAIDYRISDARATPEARFDALHSERVLRMPDSQWCYHPPAACPEPGPPPSAQRGYCTFAAFSVPAKINARVMALWSRILTRVPASRLVIIAGGLIAIPPEQREPFHRAGIAEDRLELLPAKPFAEYMAFHNQVDVVLDTFPYSGGTTTCHALWMGVPVVSLSGDTATSRGGASLLHAVGLPELLAGNEDEYVEIAAALASDARRLASLRAGLRQRVARSPLTNAERFTRNLESAYRGMWRDWCMRK